MILSRKKIGRSDRFTSDTHRPESDASVPKSVNIASLGIARRGGVKKPCERLKSMVEWEPKMSLLLLPFMQVST